MSRLPGMRVESRGLEIDRWLEKKSALRLLDGTPGGAPVRVASAVPYSQPTRGAVTAPLVHVPTGEGIGDQDVQGKIVVRDFLPGSVPRAAFAALQWSMYDPDLSLAARSAEDFERDWLSGQWWPDMRAAAEAGAAGLVFVHGFPHEQVKGHYAPYDGLRWDVPAVYVGADEGAALKQAAAAGHSARLQLKASETPGSTRTLIATLPGMSEERIAVTSHTDGINAVWDNGPIGMLAMAEHFASLPRECRPRTLEFGFTTAHLYQSEATAETYAAELDAAYEDGTVALVMALEHLGAREYDAVARPGGEPGRRFELTGLSEPNSFFVGESPVLVKAVTEAVARNDLRRSIVLRGADLPGVRLPPHHSFGGEGSHYHQHLLPTVAFVTGPWSLYNPVFGMEAIDADLFQRQLIVFTDLVYSLDETPRDALAGGYLAEREARDLLCGHSEDGFGLVRCPSEETEGAG